MSRRITPVLARLAPLPFALLAFAWGPGLAARADGIPAAQTRPVPRPAAAHHARRPVPRHRLAHVWVPRRAFLPGCITQHPGVPIYDIPCETPFEAGLID